MQTCVLKLQVLYDRPMISLQTSGPWESSVVYASILSNNLSSTPKWIEKISISLMPRWIDWLILQWKYFRKNRWWKEYNVDELIWFTIRNFIESYAIEYSHEVSFRKITYKLYIMWFCSTLMLLLIICMILNILRKRPLITFLDKKSTFINVETDEIRLFGLITKGSWFN